MDLKQQTASKALEFVQDGMVLGLGTGSTARIFINLLGTKIRSSELRDIQCVSTSEDTRNLAHQLGIQQTTLSEHPVLDMVVDGADEVDPQLNLIKGLGRALLREKIIAIHARRFVIIIDESKLVSVLGRGPLPVEIVQFEAQAHVRWLRTLGCEADLWLEEDGKPVLTDNGNYLARCWFSDGIQDATALVRSLDQRPGILEHGLFLDMADIVVVAGPDGINLMERKR